MKLSFDLFTDEFGPIPCTVTLERKGAGYVVDEICATDHDGGDLSEHLMRRISEKAEEMALDLVGDAADREYDERRDAAASAAYDRAQTDSWVAGPLTALQNYEANAEAKGWK